MDGLEQTRACAQAWSLKKSLLLSKYRQTWKNLWCVLCCHRNWQDSQFNDYKQLFYRCIHIFQGAYLKSKFKWLFLLLPFSKGAHVLRVFTEASLWVPLQHTRDSHCPHIPLRLCCTTSLGPEVHMLTYRQFSITVVITETCSLSKINANFMLLLLGDAAHNTGCTPWPLTTGRRRAGLSMSKREGISCPFCWNCTGIFMR